MAEKKHAVLTVSKLNALSRQLLESELGLLWVMAEVSNFVRASSGHWYFTLKDSHAQVRAAMFRGNNRHIRTMPKNGDQVMVRARISLYEPRGDYQLIVEQLQADGEGQLKQQFEQLKNQLQSEGLFDQQYKKALPRLIRRVGIITSATGAALHDILTVLKRRSPMTEVVIYPSQVQGQPASQQLRTMLQLANQRNEVDVIILGRGGGSLEDLWCFNDEGLARSIFASQLPVISAVGHEVDVSIADFVADLRAPTPSAAAELVSLDQHYVQQQLNQLLQRLKQQMQQRLRHWHHDCRHLSQHLHQFHPQQRLLQQHQQLDRLEMRLTNLMEKKLSQANQRREQYWHQLQQFSPQQQLQLARQRWQQVQHDLFMTIEQQLQRHGQRLATQTHLLNTLSPLTTVSRGYSITFIDEQVVKSARQLHSGDKIVNRFEDGEVTSIVE